MEPDNIGSAKMDELEQMHNIASARDEIDGAGRALMADGGTEEIRDAREVRDSDDALRYHSPSSARLYAYREGNEHVIVSRGNEPRHQWTKIVPAERNAVLAGEQLWTIPDNWNHRLTIKGSAESRYAVYHIPETDVDVLLNCPDMAPVSAAYYSIKRVGEFRVTYDDEINWDDLQALVEIVHEIEEVSEDVAEGLETLYRRRREFERKFVDSVNEFAEEALFERGHGRESIIRWTADPWSNPFKFDNIMQEILEVDNDTCDAMLDELSRESIIPPYPTVRVDVEEGRGVPEGYDIRALVEAGTSGAETIDYLVTEHYDLMTQTEWAKIRDIDASSISKNVSGAKSELSD